MIKNHKPGCMANLSCLVIHPDGICPGPYGQCTCDFPKQTPAPEKEWEELVPRNRIIANRQEAIALIASILEEKAVEVEGLMRDCPNHEGKGVECYGYDEERNHALIQAAAILRR